MHKKTYEMGHRCQMGSPFTPWPKWNSLYAPNHHTDAVTSRYTPNTRCVNPFAHTAASMRASLDEVLRRGVAAVPPPPPWRTGFLIARVAKGVRACGGEAVWVGAKRQRGRGQHRHQAVAVRSTVRQGRWAVRTRSRATGDHVATGPAFVSRRVRGRVPRRGPAARHSRLCCSRTRRGGRAKPPWSTSCARRAGPHSDRPRRTVAGWRRWDADSCCTAVPRGHVRRPPQWMMIKSVVHRLL